MMTEFNIGALSLSCTEFFQCPNKEMFFEKLSFSVFFEFLYGNFKGNPLDSAGKNYSSHDISKNRSQIYLQLFENMGNHASFFYTVLLILTRDFETIQTNAVA